MTTTAAEARARAARLLTEEELAERYSEGIRDIELRADRGYYSTDQRVVTELSQEYQGFLAGLGYRVFGLSHGNDQARSAASQIEGDSADEIVIIWQTYEFSETRQPLSTSTENLTTTPLAEGQGPNLDWFPNNPLEKFMTVNIRATSGFQPGQELYYKITGTLVAADFSDSSDEGTVVFDEQGEASVILQLKSGRLAGKTCQVKITWDSAHTAVLYTTGVITTQAVSI